MQTQYKAYTLGEALCSTLNLVILTINFDFNIICVQCNVIRNFIHITLSVSNVMLLGTLFT